METRRTKILGFMLLLAGLALCSTGLWLLLSPAQFKAATTIKLEPDDPDINGQVSYNPYFLQTELEIIQSPLVLSNVVESLNLNVRWGKKYGNGNPLETAKSISRLQRQMKLEPILNSELLKISFFGHDPNEAAGIANAIAKSYFDFRMERWKQLTRAGIQVLAEQYQINEQNIKTNQENLGQLAKQLNLPNPEPTGELLRSNYPSYFQAKQELQKLMSLHKKVATTIETWRLKIQIPNTSLVEIIYVAEPPKFPSSPNRWLGMALMVIGLFSTVGGFLLLKSSRRSG
jgi:uncharacterized protein involved in exopolysaccharide biosynthesis